MSKFGALDALTLACALALTGCGEAASPNQAVSASNAALSAPATAPAPAPPPPAPAGPVLQRGGYDTIRIGAAPTEAEGHSLADDGSYEDACRIYTDPGLPGLYAIVENGIVMRLTAFDADRDMATAPIRTGRGIGPGSAEAEVRAAYSPLREQPHHYVEPPAKDLFFGGSEQAPGLRFEIGADGRVSGVHAGLMPTLAYVEGCS